MKLLNRSNNCHRLKHAIRIAKAVLSNKPLPKWKEQIVREDLIRFGATKEEVNEIIEME